MLDALGYEVGKVDGVFEETMTEAVEKFQEDKKLEPTGTVKEETAFAIMDALRVKIEEDDPQLLEAKKIVMEEAGIAAEPAKEEEAEEPKE
jgi:carboxyl-terminal processing protease